ncbi:MAG: hypothetical protein L0Y50_00200 [Beijerinckiaceae bacterium]|nr:hypothetical protein [Beijerinckiaceae bacterium]
MADSPRRVKANRSFPVNSQGRCFSALSCSSQLDSSIDAGGLRLTGEDLDEIATALRETGN